MNKRQVPGGPPSLRFGGYHRLKKANDSFSAYLIQPTPYLEFSSINPFTMTLDEAQKSVDTFIQTVGVRYFNELTNLGILMEEVGELSRLMVRTYGEQSFKESDKGRELGDEMADVLWVLICLANQTGVNLTEAFQNNLQKKQTRDADRHLLNPKLGE